ncbi:osmotically inducible protein C [Candidatus Fermentibacteria bacterium]|nr:MAG: osmotically inducible protein C [Candidatus Fermentibacteria bacterium]
MAKKIVKVEGVQDSSFKMELTAGNHTVTIDQPKPMGGRDQGPNPLEYGLFALAGCIGAIGRIMANQRKMDIRGFKISCEAELNTDNLLGQSKAERAGYKWIKVITEIDADMTAEEKAAFLAEVDERCPISDVFANGTEITFETV